MSLLEPTANAMAEERSMFLAHLEAVLGADQRIVAAWIGGSIGRGEADDLSDIDIHLAVADEHCIQLNAQRRAFVAQFGEALLIQEAPQNAPEGGAFQLVLYRGATAPIEVDWSWRPASTASIHAHAVVLFDRSAGLPRAASWIPLSPTEVAKQISLSTTFFWAMAFIAAKKIARRQPEAAFGLLRMMHQAHASVREHLAGKPRPTWGAIGSPRERPPPTELQAQITDLLELVDEMLELQPTTDGEGGLVTADAVAAVKHFVGLVWRASTDQPAAAPPANDTPRRVGQGVRDYYARFGEREWARLENPSDGQVEFAITRGVLARYLQPGSRVLDLGGGPGRYTIWLADQGHRVTLGDLSNELLSLARTHIREAAVQDRVEAIIELDACDLSVFPDASFDAVVCLGPFYHLPDRADRARAASELSRVLRHGGVIFVGLMPRLALLRRTMALADERQHLLQPNFLEQLLGDGAFFNDVPGRFTHGYGVRPEEVGSFFDQMGFDELALLSTESITVGLQDALADLLADEALAATVLGLASKYAAEASALGFAYHLMYVGRRRASPIS